MIIIADSHISDAAGNQNDFFSMLKAFEGNDEDIIFLGDIFDLWIALPRYESGIHRRFLGWCRENKKHRTIGFAEGNHEFFVADEKRDIFSWSSSLAWYADPQGNFFCHGDQINSRDRNYLLFRRFIKNRCIKTVIRFFPYGPVVFENFKKSLKKTNRIFKKQLPVQEIRSFARTGFDMGAEKIFTGHFHRKHIYCDSSGKELHILPDWFSSETVVLYNEKSGHVSYHHWSEINNLPGR